MERRILLLLLGLFLVSQRLWALDDEADTCLADGSGKPCYVTGNGFGYAVVSSKDGSLRKFLAHPCSMEKDDKKNPGSDGIETNNYLQNAKWSVNGKPVNADSKYSDESQVISGDAKDLKQQFFMPFGLKHNALIATAQSSNRQAQACLNMQWEHPVNSESQRNVEGSDVVVMHFDGVKEPLVAVPLSSDASVNSDSSCRFGGSGWAFVSVKDDSQVTQAVKDLKKWQKGDPADSLASREERELNNWRGTAAVCFTSEAQRKLYRQSETVLRMAQIQEPNDSEHRANGMINASLPTGEFVVPFVRDMSYATVGLVKSGHQEEAKKAVLAYYNAGPMGLNKSDAHGNYQISTARYFCNGQEDADFSGQAKRNFELDSWGLALWATGSYFNKYPDKSFLKTQTLSGPLYQSVRDKLVMPLFKNLDSYNGGLIVAKDTSSWEQNDEVRRHYAYSTITAIGGLKQFLPMAEAAHDEKTVALVKQKLALLEKGFNEAYVQDGHLRGSIEPSPKNDTDGALIEAVNMGVPLDRKVIDNTINRYSVMKVPSGGYLRVHNPDGNDEYEKHEFVFINFMMARALLKLGRGDEADKLIARMQEKANSTNDLIPEMYVSFKNQTYPGAIGSPAGAVPMVGYGAGVNNLYIAERQSGVPITTASLDPQSGLSSSAPVCSPLSAQPKIKAADSQSDAGGLDGN